MMKYKTCLDYIIHINGCTQSSISMIWGMDRRRFNKWVTEDRPIPEEYIQKLEKLFKIPREYWLDERRRSLPYTEERKNKIYQYSLKKKWTYEGETVSDIIEELKEKQKNKEELDDVEKTLKRIEEAQSRIVQEMYNTEMKKEEQYQYYDELNEKYPEEVCSFLKKENANIQSKEDYYNAVCMREKILYRVYEILKNTDDEIIETIVASLELYNEVHTPIQGITFSNEVAEKICNLLIEEENAIIEKNKIEIEELKDIFGDDFWE